MSFHPLRCLPAASAPCGASHLARGGRLAGARTPFWMLGRSIHRSGDRPLRFSVIAPPASKSVGTRRRAIAPLPPDGQGVAWEGVEGSDGSVELRASACVPVGRGRDRRGRSGHARVQPAPPRGPHASRPSALHPHRAGHHARRRRTPPAPGPAAVPASRALPPRLGPPVAVLPPPARTVLGDAKSDGRRTSGPPRASPHRCGGANALKSDSRRGPNPQAHRNGCKTRRRSPWNRIRRQG